MTTQTQSPSHTLGPWKLDECNFDPRYPNVLPKWTLFREEFPDLSNKTGCGIVSYTKESFAYISAREANARLIASSPELLDALKECIKRLEEIEPDGNSQAYAKGCCAISKAEGREA